MDLIIGRFLPPLNSSKTVGTSSGVTTTRAGKCGGSVGTAPLYFEDARPDYRCVRFDLQIPPLDTYRASRDAKHLAADYAIGRLLIQVW
jgi:hypothetical protein